MPRRKEPRIPDAVLDQLLGGADAKTAFDPNGLLDELKKAFAERALNAELDQHLSAEAAEGRANIRNGYGRKTGQTDHRRFELEVPRARPKSRRKRTRAVSSWRFRETGCRRSIRS